jgi:uncharacterized membrane protein
MSMSSVRLRPRLVASLGPGGFLGVYSLISLAIFAALVSVYVDNRHHGTELWSLRHIPGVRGFSMWFAGGCFAMSIASFFQPSPASFGIGGKPRAHGLLRITRHPLFVPLALLGAAHLLINGFVTDVIFFGGLLGFGIVGCMHQDARKRATEGAEFAAFLDETSLLPFAAIVTGKTTFVASELPWLGIGLGIAAAVGFYHLHWIMFF